MKHVWLIYLIPLFLSAGINDFSLSQRHEKYYQKALEFYQLQASDEAFEQISRIGDLRHHTEYQILHIKILYDLMKWEEILSIIDNSSKAFIEENLTEFFYFYFQSCIKLGQEAQMTEFLENYEYLFRKHDGVYFRRILLSLFINRNYDQIKPIIDIFPAAVITQKEYYLIIGAAEFYQEKYQKAQDFLEHSYKIGDAKTRILANEYLTALHFFVGNSPELPESFTFYNKQAKINLLTNYLQHNELDNAHIVAEQLRSDKYYAPFKTLINLRLGHNKTAEMYFRESDTTLVKYYPSLQLAAAEVNYHKKDFQKAVDYYKLYRESKNADIKYANYAIGYSFKGFYRYNNTAYYWLKNIETNSSLYDSLALHDLAELYNFTEHFRISWKYYKQLLTKYSDQGLSDRFHRNYLETLFEINYFDTMLPVYDRYNYLLDNYLRKKYLLALGNHNYSISDLTTAVRLYTEYLTLDNDPDISFRVEQINYTLGEYAEMEDYLLAFIAKNPTATRAKKTGIDLIKYYIGKNDVFSAETLLDTLLSANVDKTDTLRFWDGKVKTLKGNEPEAISIYSSLISASSDSLVVKDALNSLQTLLEDKSPRRYSEVISTIVDSMVYRKGYNDIMQTLAYLYEKSELYNQANQVYFTILDDSLMTDSVAVMNKIGLNLMYQENFEDADTLLSNFMLNSEKNPETMLLIATAKMGKNEIENAINVLLNIYFDFPEYGKRKEMMLTLADNFYANNQYLPAWYFYKKLNFEDDPRTNFIINQKTSELAEIVGEDSLLVKFPKNFESSLRVMRVIEDD
jgi:hypothetical protein